jgi:hypothetical protein
MKLDFSQKILEKCLNTKFWKIRPVVAEFFHADGRTDIMKQIVALRRNAKSDYQLLASKVWLYNLRFPQDYDILNSSKHKFLCNVFIDTVIPRLTSDPANEFFG